MTTSETSAQGAKAPPTGVEPTPPPSSLDLVGVTAQRRAGRGWVTVLADLDLAVAPGELVALMGPSGSGKSSVIQMACGLLAPTAGTVRIEGEEMAGGDRAGWAAARRRHLGVVHQRLDLLGGLSVIDNVALPLLLDGGRVVAAHSAALEALARVGADHLAGRPIEDLSGGEQQRVAIARAVVGERGLVLADEPTAALDTVAAEEIVELLASLAAGGAAVLMATHDTRLASWAHRVIGLRDGRSVTTAGLAQ